MCGGIIVMCVCREWKERGANYDMGKRVMVRTAMSLNGDLAAQQVLVCVCWVMTGTAWFLNWDCCGYVGLSWMYAVISGVCSHCGCMWSLWVE